MTDGIVDHFSVTGLDEDSARAIITKVTAFHREAVPHPVRGRDQRTFRQNYGLIQVEAEQFCLT